MKTKAFLFLAFTIIPLLSVNGQLKVISSGRVGIGTDPTSDFQVKNVDQSGTKQAYTSLYMDNVNNYVWMRKGGTNRANEIRFLNLDFIKWCIGMPDSDIAGNGDEFFIGENSQGSDAIIWIEPGGSGYMGIGTNSPDPSYKLTVEGDAFATGIWEDSDIRLKKNIESINSALSSVNNLRGVTFEYKNIPSNPIEESFISYTDSSQSNPPKSRPYSPINNKRYGLIAQEVQAVIPELVHEGDSGFLALNYNGLIPILIEAIKEQQTMIDSINAKIEKLSPEVSNLKSELTAIPEDFDTENFLSQNRPNPFSQDTEIEFYIASKISNASLYIMSIRLHT